MCILPVRCLCAGGVAVMIVVLLSCVCCWLRVVLMCLASCVLCVVVQLIMCVVVVVLMMCMMMRDVHCVLYMR